MFVSTPEPLEREHHEIDLELNEATREAGPIGTAARVVADLLHPHFAKEDEFGLPPLSILQELAAGYLPSNARKVVELSDRLRANLPTMLAEHREITRALDAFAATAQVAGRPEYMHLAEKIKLHAQTEEVLQYPATLLIGEFVKQKLAQGSAPAERKVA